MRKNKLIYFLLSVAMIFTACSSDDEKIPSNPIKDATVASIVEQGAEMFISGSGFSMASALYLENASEKVDLVNVSASNAGIEVFVPMSTPVGDYKVFISSNGAWELGSISVIEASLPVTNITRFEEIKIGRNLEIAGIGFNETTQIFAVSGAVRTELPVVELAGNLICSVPSSLIAGNYSLVLAQDGGEWVIEEEVEFLVFKQLASLVFDSSKDLGSMAIVNVKTWAFNYEGDEVVSVNESAVMDIIMASASTRSSQEDAEANMHISKDGDQLFFTPESGNPFWFRLAEGIITESDVDRENGRAGNYVWKYDDNNQLKGLGFHTSTNMYWEYEYANNNLVSVDDYNVYTYANAELKNHKYGIDFAAVHCAIAYNYESFFVYAHIMNLAGKVSELLPTAHDFITFEYTFDNDGYVTEVNFNGQKMILTYR